MDSARPGSGPGRRFGRQCLLDLFQAHRYDDAIRKSRSALAVQPDNAANLMGLAFPLIADNQAAAAIPVLEKSLSLSPESPAITGVLIHAYARAGRRGDALRLLAELNRRRKAGYIPAGAFVNAISGPGRHRTGLLLARACLSGTIEHPPVPQDPSPLQPNPR